MLLKPAPVSTEKFSWFRDSRQFVAEISDFGPHWQFGRVWDDAADEGLTLVSQWSGEEIVFVIFAEDTDGDEVIGWHLKPAVRNDARLTGPIEVVVFND